MTLLGVLGRHYAFHIHQHFLFLAEFTHSIPYRFDDLQFRSITSFHFNKNFHLNFQGHPRLVNALGKLYTQLIKRAIDPLSEVAITYQLLWFCQLNNYFSQKLALPSLDQLNGLALITHILSAYVYFTLSFKHIFLQFFSCFDGLLFMVFNTQL